MRELMKNMTKKEIILDLLHIAWYIAWRWAVIVAVWAAIVLLANWEWWR